MDLKKAWLDELDKKALQNDCSKLKYVSSRPLSHIIKITNELVVRCINDKLVLKSTFSCSIFLSSEGYVVLLWLQNFYWLVISNYNMLLSPFLIE